MYLAVHHDDLPGGVAHNDGIVSCRHNGHTLLLIELPQYLKQFRRGLRIQIRGRLIGEQEYWIGDNGSSNRNTLLLATRQLARASITEIS
tara:strand:+ start:458 stop:727 length:270 start_codon:yes stop_codon:yes gene_type:complete